MTEYDVKKELGMTMERHTKYHKIHKQGISILTYSEQGGVLLDKERILRTERGKH